MGYVVRSKKGLIYVTINGDKLNSFIYPPEDPFHKICFQIRVYFQQSNISSLKVIDLNNNGDECGFCNKGYGTELVVTAFSILSHHFQVVDDAIVPIVGYLCPGENFDREVAHKRRSHFWSKFFTIEDVQNPYSKFEGRLEDVVSKAENLQIDVLWSHLPSRPSVIDIVEQLHWLPQDTLAMKAVIKDIESYYDELNNLKQRQIESKLISIAQYAKCPSVIFSWLQRMLLNQSEQRLEQVVKTSILKRDRLNFGLIYRYFKNTNINTMTELYINHFMLSPHLSLEQISTLLKARIDE